MKILQINRKKSQSYFSIESVFCWINANWNFSDKPESIYLPKPGVSILNLLFLFKVRKKRESSDKEKTVFHVTGDAHYAVLALPRNRTLLTIHDCVFLEQNIGFKRWLLKKILIDIPVSYIKNVTTISEKTKSEIVKNTGCDPQKIFVIPNPVSPDIYFRQKDFNQVRPILLFIGTKANKNLERVAKALQGLECVLQIIGKLSQSQENLLRHSNIHFKAVHSISTSEVADFYAESDVILFPSLYEGFGLPVIEGFKAGRVVVTSNLSPMKDIAEDAAILVDPYDVESIRAGIEKVIHDKVKREKLIKSGFEVVSRYEPKEIARQYYELIEKLFLTKCAE